MYLWIFCEGEFWSLIGQEAWTVLVVVIGDKQFYGQSSYSNPNNKQIFFLMLLNNDNNNNNNQQKRSIVDLVTIFVR